MFTIGDNVYPNGTAAEFTNCYQPTWGAFKARTRPTVGNHDFGNGTTANATPYFDYFNGVGNQNGPAGDRALGYYSYDVGTGPNTWHVVVLNSECESGSGYWLPGGCAAGSAQDLWLKNDLATAATNNIIAMFHKPRWSSSGGLTHMQQLWQDLYDGGADIVLGGHLHNYERFAPMAANGTADPTFGVREFVVGTGGAALTGFGTILGTSEVRNSSTYGVIKLTLHASSYDWQFLPIAGQTFTDSGTASTHGAPGNTPPTLNPVGNKSAQVGTQLAFTATATDPDAGTTLTFSLANGSGGSVPAGASITAGGNFTWTPTAGQVGPATFDVCVSDGTASDCETITVTVSSSVTLVGDWKADEGSGATLVNSSSLGATNNGAILGNPTWVAGQHGQAIRFDGTGDYATVADNSSLDISGAITMAAWVKPERATTTNLIKKAVTSGTTVNGYELSLSASTAPAPQKVFVRFNQATSGDTFRINSATTYPSNGATWMHVAATYDGTTIRLYVNGVQEGGNLAGPASIATNNLALGIGAQTGRCDESSRGRWTMSASTTRRCRPPRSQRSRRSHPGTRHRWPISMGMAIRMFRCFVRLRVAGMCRVSRRSRRSGGRLGIFRCRVTMTGTGRRILRCSGMASGM